MARRGGGSVSFDRAAGFYDRTRALGPEVEAAQTQLLVDALDGLAGPVLEIGAGTGRVAVPLAAAGLSVLGVDLSHAMLQRLRAKDHHIPVAVGDATRLPIAERAIGAAVVAHVLHLVSDWRTAIAEVERVLRPGGVLLVTRGGEQSGIRAEIQAVARTAAGWSMPAGRLDDLDPLDEHFVGRGAEVTRLPALPVDGGRNAAELLASMRHNVYSWTWDFTDGQRHEAVAAARRHVESMYGDPHRVEIPASPILWRRYRLPG